MYRGFWLREARSVVFYEGLWLWGGSGSNGPVSAGGSAKEDPHVRRGRGLSWDHTSSSDVGSYEFKRFSARAAMGRRIFVYKLSLIHI